MRKLPLLLALVLVPGGVAEAAKKNPAPKKAKPAAAKIIVPSDTIRFPFRESHDDMSRSFTLEARPPLKKDVAVQSVIAGDLLSEDGDSFPEGQITITGPTRDAFGNVKVVIALDPKGKVDVQPGEYTGTLTVAGKGIEPGAVTITALVRDSKRKAILWALLGFAAGLLVKIAGDFSRGRPGRLEVAAMEIPEVAKARQAQIDKPGRNPAPANERYWTAKEYFVSGSFASSLLLGFVGAAAAYALAYLGNDTWGADSFDNWKVAAAAFAGVLTGVSGADLVKPFQPAAPSA